jgi:hypothetical protein
MLKFVEMMSGFTSVSLIIKITAENKWLHYRINQLIHSELSGKLPQPQGTTQNRVSPGFTYNRRHEKWWA